VFFTDNKLVKSWKHFAKRSPLFCRATLAAFLTCNTATIAYAQLSADQIKVYTQANEAQRIYFLIGQAKLGKKVLIEELLQKFPLKGQHRANRKLFIEGLLLNAGGSPKSAIIKFRAALANDPSLTMVRSELAQTLIVLEEDDSAKHHLEILQSTAPTPEASNSIKVAIEQLAARRPLKFNGFVTIAPSTNLNGGSNHSKITSNNPHFIDGEWSLSPSKQKKSGVGIGAGFGLSYNKKLNNKFELVLTGDASARLYANKSSNSLALNETAELRLHLDKGYLGFGALADQIIDPNLLQAEKYFTSYASIGPRISARYFPTQRDQISGSLVAEFRDYKFAPNLNATDFRGDVTWSHAFDSSLQTSVSVGLESLNPYTGPTNNSFKTGFISFGSYKELSHGLTLGTTFQGRYVKFDEMDAVTFKLREDFGLRASASITKRDWDIFGFAPSLSYMYNRNLCNIEIWDFDSHNIDFRLTKDF
jgi:outer membrane protein